MSLVTSVSAAEFEAAATHVCDAEHNHDVEAASGDLQITPFGAKCPECGQEMRWGLITDDHGNSYMGYNAVALRVKLYTNKPHVNVRLVRIFSLEGRI